ncbi:MAG TPA: FAD-binding protein [Nocardioides sp.]|nr:FAD-binding protein [Nocardioides sp.]
MTGWSRRAVLAAGGMGALAACGSPRADLGASSSAPTVAPPRWAQLRRHLTGSLARPGDPAYDRVRLLQNPRYDAERPLAVLSARTPRDVATGLTFAQDHGLPIAIRSGGHSYPGWSGGGRPRALVIDVRPMAAVTWAGTTATIGAGAALAHVYDQVAGRGRAIPGGSCATVGIGGLALGGGVGVLTRALGLTCDAVRSISVVTADGHRRTASTDEEPDLFWALRGGGGGHLGVVTSFDLATSVAPTVTSFYLAWPWARAGEVVDAWQGWAPAADRRLWSTLKLLGGAKHPGGPTVFVSGTWIGASSALDGRLAPFLRHLPAPSARAVHVRGFGDAMAAYGGAGAPREAFAATSHVAYDPLDQAGTADLVGAVEAVSGAGLKEVGASVDALGGAAGQPAPGDTAFVHRAALATVQYTATFPSGTATTADAAVHRLRAAMEPHWGEHAYVNYADATLRDYRSAYFGANATRLAQVRATYDPHRFFTQPQDF